MYQPSFRCRRCLESIHPDSGPNWAYELCKQCLHRCAVCDCLVDDECQCDGCNKYVCFFHITMTKYKCHNCMLYDRAICNKCHKVIIGQRYEYEDEEFTCQSCATRCNYEYGCDQVATSWHDLCSHHYLISMYPIRSIFHPFINVHHVASIKTILMALRKRVPRPIVMMIIDRAFNN